MRLSRHRRGSEMQMNMTPMIDVTFLLLIFFMTVNQVTRVESAPVELPLLKGTQDQADKSLTINVDQRGEIIVSGNTIALPQLVAILTDAIADNEGDPGRVTVVLRADRRGDCRTVNQIVSALVRLEITRVRIAVRSDAP